MDKDSVIRMWNHVGTVIVPESVAITRNLREFYKLPVQRRYPNVGDIVEVTRHDFSRDQPAQPTLGLCTGYHKGWCYVRARGANGDEVWLDFIVDEKRHGKSKAVWKIRDDLNVFKESKVDAQQT